uniref:Uncharacterized protein n=1 Tax=Rangifer tarandus platyrhynchus TaxID=3082113 RepID=A0ACB0EJH4_RANTA|nr:unnamed protein product [Rangifer tarandus platyrhynchus]
MQRAGCGRVASAHPDAHTLVLETCENLELNANRGELEPDVGASRVTDGSWGPRSQSDWRTFLLFTRKLGDWSPEEPDEALVPEMASVRICTRSCVPRVFCLTREQLPGLPPGRSAAVACCPFLEVGPALAQEAGSLLSRTLIVPQPTRAPCLPQVSPCNQLPQCQEERPVNPTLDVAFASKLHPVSEGEKQNPT